MQISIRQLYSRSIWPKWVFTWINWMKWGWKKSWCSASSAVTKFQPYSVEDSPTNFPVLNVPYKANSSRVGTSKIDRDTEEDIVYVSLFFWCFKVICSEVAGWGRFQPTTPESNVFSTWREFSRVSRKEVCTCKLTSSGRLRHHIIWFSYH